MKMGTSWCENIKVACSDMWRPYLKVIAEKLPNALNILDRFHIVKKLNEAVNKVRVEEVKQYKTDGYEPVMTGPNIASSNAQKTLPTNSRFNLTNCSNMIIKRFGPIVTKKLLMPFGNTVHPIGLIGL